MKKSEQGYSSDWDEISARQKKRHQYTCEDCKVILSDFKNLVQTHHVNGVKSDNAENNLRVLCLACHRLQPMHSHVYVSKKKMRIISQARNRQNIKSGSWAKAIMLADTSLRGILDILKTHDVSVPVMGYELSITFGDVVFLDCAWPNSKVAIVLTSSDHTEVNGWHIFTLEELINNHKLILRHLGSLETQLLF